MTTSEAAYRLLRHCSVTDIAAVSISQATELMGALGIAVGMYFRHGPAVLRQTSATVSLAAPLALTGLSVAAGAHEVTSGSPFAGSQRGSSLIIAGDENRNEVVSAVGWLNPYMGTTGTKTATLYGDCAPIGTQLIERILTDPIVLDQQRTDHRPALQRVRTDHDMRMNWRDTTGYPECYAIEATGVSRGASSQFLIRVWPMPDRAILLRFECEVQPDMFDALNVTSIPIELPFSDAQMETILLPLAEREMLASTLMDDVSDRIAAQLEARADRAASTLKTLPRDHGRSRGRIYTPRGW